MAPATPTWIAASRRPAGLAPIEVSGGWIACSCSSTTIPNWRWTRTWRIAPDGCSSSTGGLPGFTAQVDHPGGVDLSTLLGLDRRSYAATAWVEQSHPLPVLDQAGDGRNDLQRAVALCIGEDEAARAIQRLDRGPPTLRRQPV